MKLNPIKLRNTTAGTRLLNFRWLRKHVLLEQAPSILSVKGYSRSFFFFLFFFSKQDLSKDALEKRHAVHHSGFGSFLHKHMQNSLPHNRNDIAKGTPKLSCGMISFPPGRKRLHYKPIHGIHSSNMKKVINRINKNLNVDIHLRA